MAAFASSRALELPRVAIVSADRSVMPGVKEFLAPLFQTVLVETYPEVFPLLASVALDAVMVDVDTDGPKPHGGISVLRELRQASSDLLLIALSRSRGAAPRLAATEAGADDFFVAPVDFQELQVVLQRALERRAVEIEARRVREQLVGRMSFQDLIGGSEPMRRVYDALVRVGATDTTVLLRGESGTGKELAARAIVTMSNRRDGPFVSLNCAAMPENLMEAELFGHEKGAFTGASDSRAGDIEQAHSGTLFLDEIATLGLQLQTKLLRVLEDRSVKRLGGKAARKIDFRLITATNENLEEMVRAGRFREDLYYRINVVPVFLPPLRERVEDIALLADHFMRLYCAANRIPLKRLDGEVIEVFEQYPWPGNVRELQNMVQRLVLMAEGPVILAKHLPQGLLCSATTQQEALLVPEGGIDFDDEMRRIEIAYLKAALRRAGGSKREAASLLRVDPQRIKYLARKYNLE